ncbi:hypothetical protein GGF40_003451 [Coemansia sp. RSA 1286]|nr:hypothetical protein GGF40_003451 [Coemansia sp. RSA 1286]
MKRNIQLLVLLVCLMCTVALALPADGGSGPENFYKREIDQETRDNYLKAIVIILGIMLGIQVVSLLLPLVTACIAGCVSLCS